MKHTALSLVVATVLAISGAQGQTSYVPPPDISFTALPLGVSIAELDVQSLRDVRALLRTGAEPGGRKSLHYIFKTANRMYRGHGHRRIASAIRHSLPTLRELAAAEAGQIPASEVDRERGRRAIHRVLVTSLAIQKLDAPSAKDPVVPFYTLVAVHYGAQMKRALANAGKNRPISKRIGGIPKELWIRDDSSLGGHSLHFSQSMAPAGYYYSVSGAVDVALGGFEAYRLLGFAESFDWFSIPPEPYYAIRDGEALPATATIALAFTKSSDVISLHGFTYDLSALEDGQAYRLVSIPNASDVPAGAIPVNRVTN